MDQAPDTNEMMTTHFRFQPHPHLRSPIMAVAAFSLFALLHPSGLQPALADKIKHPRAIYSGLDKITGRIIGFEVAIDETVQFGSLQITPRVCYTRPATEAPQTTSFIEVDEIDTSNQYKRIFSGWVYADSPGLNGIEHAVYDIWLNDCKGGSDIIVTVPDAPEPAADPGVADLQPKPPKPGTVPKPRRTAPLDPGLQPPPPVALAPPVERRKPTQSFFPTAAVPGQRPERESNR